MEIGTLVKVYNRKTNEFIKDSEVVEVTEDGKFRLAYDFFYYIIKTNLSYDGKTRVEITEDLLAKRREKLLSDLKNLPKEISDKDLKFIARVMDKKREV